jgi:predicted nucleic acid-binding protein
MAKLHELLAVLGDASTASSAIIKETSNTFSKKPDHFKGQTRKLEFFEESRSGENVSETKEIVTTVDDKLDHTCKVVGRYWDALLEMEATNATAKADIVLPDGTVVAKDVPATFLLGMETRLKEFREMLNQMPTLDPALNWKQDDLAGDHIYVSDPQVNFRTEKQLKHKVLYEATKEHPAQIEKYMEDRPVGRIETVHRSGMITPRRKADILENIGALLTAVKKARQRANTAEVESRKIAKDMFAHILG